MRPLRSLAPILLALGVAVAGAAPLLAQEEPLAAGSEGVPVPKKTKHVQPTYPQEALAQGVRGIVILDIVVDTQGKVESTNVVRSVPGLDEAAIAAARQWEYEPTKVGGKPVRVRITVPITFALALPQLARQDGIPELRQGVSPAWPAGAEGGGLAAAEVTLEPDGRVGGARVLDGGAPWSGALLAALRTWRFAPPPDDAVLSFRVEAEFVSAGGSAPQQRKVTLKATGLQRSGLLDEPAPPASAPAVGPAATAAVPAGLPSPATPSRPPRAPSRRPRRRGADARLRYRGLPPHPRPRQWPRPAALPAAPIRKSSGGRGLPPLPRRRPPLQRRTSPVAPGVPRALRRRPSPRPRLTAPPSTAPAAGATAAPPVEVITAPPPAAAPENGVSAIRDVTLEPGVPDLTRGRRPVVPASRPHGRDLGERRGVLLRQRRGDDDDPGGDRTGPAQARGGAGRGVVGLPARAHRPGLPGRCVHLRGGQGNGRRAAPGPFGGAARGGRASGDSRRSPDPATTAVPTPG